MQNDGAIDGANDREIGGAFDGAISAPSPEKLYIRVSSLRLLYIIYYY